MRDLVSTLLPARRAPRNAVPVPYSSGLGGLFSSDVATSSGEREFAAYGSVGTLFAIVFQIGQAFASTDWHLYRKGPARAQSLRKEVLQHPFVTVWNRPNPFYTGRMFRETCQQHLDLVGETFFVLFRIGGLIVEMWPVRPDRMKPIKDPSAYLLGWMYVAPDGEEIPLANEDVIQIKYPNPSDPYRGMGPVQTVLNDIDASTYSAEWNKNFFINGARPGGIIQFDYKMGDTEFRDFINRWREQHKGVANAHRVAVLENAKWVETNFTMQDMQFAELRNLPRELIREAFAYPKPMLGTVDDVNRANAEAGMAIMAEGQTNPRLSRWKDIVNVFLLPQFINGVNLELDYDDPTPVNMEAANAQRASQATAVATLVSKGFDPDESCDWAGMPRIKWVGIPSPAAVTTSPAEDQQAEQAQPDEQSPAQLDGRRSIGNRRTMPIIDLDEDEYELVSEGR
jgi:HK97 family phage portal protein